MKLTLGFSPCPNDTFIFDALVNQKIDTEGLQFDYVLEDVQTLNEWAAAGKVDITKLSFPALFDHADQYEMLQSGAALGKGVGPLLIAKAPVDAADFSSKSVAIPGINTTANFLLQFAFPALQKKSTYLFSQIEDAVLQEEVDLGVIIHENRFTYQQKGLHKVADLGEIWEQQQQLPIPLGCIAIKRSFPNDLISKVERLITSSLQFAFDNYPKVPAFVTAHAQEMQPDVVRKHIELYVNNYSLHLGDDGRRAVDRLKEVYLML